MDISRLEKAFQFKYRDVAYKALVRTLTDKASGIGRVTKPEQLKEVEIKPGDILHTVSEVGHLQVFNLSMDHFTHRRDELEKTHVKNYWKLQEGFPDGNISRLVSEDINLTNELYSVGIS